MAAGIIDVLTEESGSCNKDEEDISKYESDLSLIDMPVEIFIKICNMLSLKYVNNLRSTCKRFYTILSDDSLWRRWMKIIMPNSIYPPHGDDLDCLRKNCVLMDNVNNEWKDTKKYLVVCAQVHSGDIDALLMKNGGDICISGGRDRLIALWDLKKYADNSDRFSTEGNESRKRPEFCFKTPNAHEGWIWDLATPTTNSDMFLSCSWDSTVKLWDLTPMREVRCFKCSSAVLCIACIDENITIAGLSCAQLILLDKRCDANPVSIYGDHQRSILCVTTKAPGSYSLYSGSEDRHIGVFDTRKDGYVRMVKLPKSKNRPSEIPLKIVANDQKCKNALFIGDTSGTLYTFNMELSKVTYINRLWKCKRKSNQMTGLSLDTGLLSACSANGSMVIRSPSEPPNSLMEYTLEDNLKFTATSILNDTLACGNNNQVRFWIPYRMFQY